MNERVLGTGYYEITPVDSGRSDGCNERAVLLLADRRASTVVPLDTESIDEQAPGELVARLAAVRLATRRGSRSYGCPATTMSA